MKQPLRFIWPVYACFAAILLLSGCGGGGKGHGGQATAAQTTGSGALRFRVDWPQPSRLIPDAAKSIKIVLRHNGRKIQERIVVRPFDGGMTSVIFDNVPADEITFTATAYADEQASGTAQAQGIAIVQVLMNASNDVSLTMDSTIATVQITPDNPSVQAGETVTLAGSALDADGQLVLTSDARWTWSSDNPAVATVTPENGSATVTGIAVGSAAITATETESGQSSRTTITVVKAEAPLPSAYEVTDLGSHRINDYHVFGVYGLNNRGDVVGEDYYDSYFDYSTDKYVVYKQAFVQPASQAAQNLGILYGYKNSVAGDINALGQVVGASYTMGGSRAESQAFFWQSGTGGMIGLGFLPGDDSSWAGGINDSGQVAGTSYVSEAGSTDHAFVWSSSTGMIGLGSLPGHTSATASDLNNQGQVVGNSYGSAGENSGHAFLWEPGGGMTDLGTLPDYPSSIAYAVNDAVQIVVNAYDGAYDVTSWFSKGYATLWEGGAGLLRLGSLPGYDYSLGRDINNQGHVVGYAYALGDPALKTAFVWQRKQGMTDLNSLIPANSGWVLKEAFEINDNGQIIGVGTLNGEDHSFLLTPR